MIRLVHHIWLIPKFLNIFHVSLCTNKKSSLCVPLSLSICLVVMLVFTVQFVVSRQERKRENMAYLGFSCVV